MNALEDYFILSELLCTGVDKSTKEDGRYSSEILSSRLETDKVCSVVVVNGISDGDTEPTRGGGCDDDDDGGHGVVCCIALTQSQLLPTEKNHPSSAVPFPNPSSTNSKLLSPNTTTTIKILNQQKSTTGTKMKLLLNKRYSTITLILILLILYIVYFLWDSLTPINVNYVKEYSEKLDIREYIPHVIHQSWKNTTLPKKFEKWSKTWKTNHPTWEYILWTDQENRNLVKDHYPWFLTTFDNLPTNIMRADVSRYMYMHKYGGIYSDLDMESLSPLDSYILGEKLILGSMGSSIIKLWQHSLPNALLISIKNHPFWIYCLYDVMENSSKKRGGFWAYFLGLSSTELISGPAMLHRVYLRYRNLSLKDRIKNPISISKLDVFYPYDWGLHDSGEIYNKCSGQLKTFNEIQCKLLVTTKNSRTITYWTHSWEKSSKGNADLDH